MNAATRRLFAIASVSSALLLAALLPGCGGGVSSGGTGSFASGPITGFGSVIVGSVRYDDATAAVEDGDGNRKTRDDLRLGMTVEIDAGPVSSTSTGDVASASRIRYDSELRGPATLVFPLLGSFSVLGQRVTVDGTTAFDEALGALSTLAEGTFVEVFAVYDPAQARYRAKRVAPASTAEGARIRGPVSALDATAQTLRIGGVTYAFAGAIGVPAGVQEGQFVRLRVAPQPGVGGRFQVNAFTATLPAVPDLDGARLRGLISRFESATSFAVGGRQVDATGAALSGGALGVGVRVDVQGRQSGGVLRATRVQVESDDDDLRREFEFTGTITATNPAQQQFVLRGQTVSTTRPDLRYDNGTAANLMVGRRVEVRGFLSADRLRVEATRIRFE